MLSDQAVRLEATDPTKSFIVKAPAGSGKTEILIQRYLRLLTLVEAPEQIVAITFTKKAANEMRERILLALEGVNNNIIPTSLHLEQTFSYAKKALKRDKFLKWNLLQNPYRMQILTIDALCQKIIHTIPFNKKVFSNITTNAKRYYRLAALNFFNYCLNEDECQNAIKKLLYHFDNNKESLLELFSDLLEKREQWLKNLYHVKLLTREKIEKALFLIEQHEISRFTKSIHNSQLVELIELLKLVAIIENDPATSRYFFKTLQLDYKINRELCINLANILLTTQNTLRKSFDYRIGLKKDLCTKEEYQQISTKSKLLLANLSENHEFTSALLRVKQMPAPKYSDNEWEILQTLFKLLPLLVAHLDIAFNDNNETDFIKISSLALEALGSEENPTDQALYFDYQIHHLLIDEFQDTSIEQHQLLTKLIKEWYEDNKTIFVVGDPMQSIYRFRCAEVGLFLRVEHEGLGPKKLTCLELKTNFRSNEQIVNWVNNHFNYIFPKFEDIESGAIAYNFSIPLQSSNDGYVKAFITENITHEAQEIVKIVDKLLNANTKNTIAILVRSRKQLREITRTLHLNKIDFQGVEIDSLATLAHIQDVWTLTRLLHNPFEKSHWLAFLRSPWCGLKLNDLHHIAMFNEDIFYSLSNLIKIKELSNEGAKRASFIFNILKTAFNHRFQLPLTQWLLQTLNALHYDKILTAREKSDLEQFYDLISEFEQNGQIIEINQFQNQLSKLYSKETTHSRLQIMTIHKSKGLEFDFVILPGLSAKPPKPERPLIRFLKLPTEHNEILLCSPIKAHYEDESLLYNYIGKLDVQKNHYEMQRLLYVATTRAKKGLYLFDYNEKSEAQTFRGLLTQQTFTSIKVDEETTEHKNLPILSRLPENYYELEDIKYLHSENKLPLTEDSLPRITGIITHELLQWICDNHPATFKDVCFNFTINKLMSVGLTGDILQDAICQIKRQIESLFNDDKGLWIIKKHINEINEYEVLIEYNNEIQTRIIDRTFKDKGIRWIIDFKTGNEMQSQEYYTNQLEQYAEILTNKFQEPVFCGLYYLNSNSWIEWPYNISARKIDKEKLSCEV